MGAGGRGGVFFSLPRCFINISFIPLEIQVSSAYSEVITGEEGKKKKKARGGGAGRGYIERETRGCCRARRRGGAGACPSTMGRILQTLCLLLLITPCPCAVITGVSAGPVLALRSLV